MKTLIDNQITEVKKITIFVDDAEFEIVVDKYDRLIINKFSINKITIINIQPNGKDEIYLT